MYKIVIRLKYARKSLEFIVPGITKGNLTLPDYYYDKDCVILEGTTYLRSNIAVFSSSLIHN